MRRWIKYILIIFAGTFVVGLLLIAIVLLTFDNDDYRQLAMRSVSYFTDYTLTIDGPFKLELSANPCLTAEEIKLKTKDDRPPPISSIEKFSAKIDLRQLISWNLVVKELQAEDAVMTVKINDPVESARGLDDSPILSGDIDLPVFESVRLRNIQMAVIDATAKRIVDIRLHRFDLDDVRNAGPMFLTGEGTIGGQEFSIDGRMGALVAMFKGEKPYPVDFEINLAGISLSVTGTFEDFMEAEGMNLQISGEVAELADLFGLLQIESPPLGRLKFEAAVSHDLNTPRVPYFSVALSGVEQIQFSANGTVANALTGKGANIDFSGSCAIDKILRTIKLESLSGLNLVRVSGRLWETPR